LVYIVCFVSASRVWLKKALGSPPPRQAAALAAPTPVAALNRPHAGRRPQPPPRRPPPSPSRPPSPSSCPRPHRSTPESATEEADAAGERGHGGAMAGRLMVGESRWWRGGSRRRLGEGCGEGGTADMQTGCRRFGSQWGNGRCRRRWGTTRAAASLSLPGIPSLWYDALSLCCHPRFLCPPSGIKPTAATTGRVALLDRVCARVCSSEVELTGGRAAGRIYRYGGEQERGQQELDALWQEVQRRAP
jgi:hypothetical protein